MDTAYKTRAWWMLRALAYFMPLAEVEDAWANGRKVHGLGEQGSVWAREGVAAARAAVTPEIGRAHV